jgi:hypothetical protein
MEDETAGIMLIYVVSFITGAFACYDLLGDIFDRKKA